MMFNWALQAAAQTRPEVAAYKLPDDVQRVGPFSDISRHKIYRYYIAGTGVDLTDPKNKLGAKIYKGDVLMSDLLYKNGVMHGTQRYWYDNGVKDGETPYFEGYMDGTVKKWDRNGKLIAQFDMEMGAGQLKVYGQDGILEQDVTLKNNIPNGLKMHRYENGERSIIYYKDSIETGPAYNFYPDGSLHRLSFYSIEAGADDRIVHGPSITWDLKGEIVSVYWFVKNRNVMESEYAKAAQNDPTLPAYLKDPQQYKKYVTDEIKSIVEKYRTMPRVKIPLEFDAQGNPVLAPVQTPPATPPTPK